MQEGPKAHAKAERAALLQAHFTFCQSHFWHTHLLFLPPSPTVGQLSTRSPLLPPASFVAVCCCMHAAHLDSSTADSLPNPESQARGGDGRHVTGSPWAFPKATYQLFSSASGCSKRSPGRSICHNPKPADSGPPCIACYQVLGDVEGRARAGGRHVRLLVGQSPDSTVVLAWIGLRRW